MPLSYSRPMMVYTDGAARVTACPGSTWSKVVSKQHPLKSMEKIAVARLTKEYAKIRKSPIDGIVVCPNESNLREWHYLLAGSRDSSYRGGVHALIPRSALTACAALCVCRRVPWQTGLPQGVPASASLHLYDHTEVPGCLIVIRTRVRHIYIYTLTRLGPQPRRIFSCSIFLCLFPMTIFLMAADGSR